MIMWELSSFPQQVHRHSQRRRSVLCLSVQVLKALRNLFRKLIDPQREAWERKKVQTAEMSCSSTQCQNRKVPQTNSHPSCPPALSYYKVCLWGTIENNWPLSQSPVSSGNIWSIPPWSLGIYRVAAASCFILSLCVPRASSVVSQLLWIPGLSHSTPTLYSNLAAA